MDNNKNQSLMKGMLIYAIGNFGTKILAFLIVPLYTYYISTSDMGTYDLLISTVSLLTPIITLQIADASYSFMIRDRMDHKLCVRTSMQVLLFNSVISILVIVGVNCFFPIPFFWDFIWLSVTTNILTVVQRMLRGLKNQVLFAISGVIYTAVFLTLNVVQITVLHQGVRSLLTSAIIANLFALGSIYLLERKLWTSLFRKPDFPGMKEMLRFAIPLIPNQLNWWVINSSNRYIISLSLGNSANGIFAISYKFPTILQLVLSLFNTSWQDVVVADNEDSGAYYTSVFRTLYILSFTLLLPLIPATKLVIVWFMEQSYHSAAAYVAFLYLGTVFQSFASFYGVGYLRGKDTKRASTTSIYGAVVNVVLHLCLIPFIGLQAAAISTFVGFLVMWLVRERHNRKELNIRVKWGEFAFYFLPVLILCVGTIFTNVLFDCILTGVGGVLFLVLNRKMILDLLKKILKK